MIRYLLLALFWYLFFPVSILLAFTFSLQIISVPADTSVSLPVLSSTLLLTGLLCVGLVFFIRAASKDRTQVTNFVSRQSTDQLEAQLIAYFEGRAYRRQESSEPADWLQFQGQVRPSLFLAVFLSLLAAIGLLCMALVLAILFASVGSWFLGLLLFAPLAALFYWKKAAREEAIAFKLNPMSVANLSTATQLTFKGHRDEVIQLTASIPLESLD